MNCVAAWLLTLLEVCLSPIGMAKADASDSKPVLRIFGAGTTCVDWSAMGSQSGQCVYDIA